MLCNYVTITGINARLIWIKLNQEYLRDSENHKVLTNQLNLYEDEHYIIRSKGRLQDSSLPEKTKNPILLHRDHKLLVLIVEDSHRIVLHRGEKQTLTEVRKQYWIIRGKSFVKKMLYLCIICKKLNGRPYTYPQQPPLPSERVRNGTPFSATGVDHLGPVHMEDVYDVSEEETLHQSFITLYTNIFIR